MALNKLNLVDPYNYKTPIYTQVSKGTCPIFVHALIGDTHAQIKWAMVGLIGIIFALLPETPWWLVSQGKIEKASNVLQMCNGRVEGYDVQEQLVSPPFPLRPGSFCKFPLRVYLVLTLM